MIKVLIVDDESWNRELFRSLGQWEALEMEVVGEAADGEEALRQIEAMRPHIVITDMRMPAMDGVQLMGRIRERYADTKVIVVSGYDDFEYARQAIKHRAVDYLLKPIDPQELNNVLNKCREDIRQTLVRTVGLNYDSRVTALLLPYKRLFHTGFKHWDEEGLLAVFRQLHDELAASTALTPDSLKQVIYELRLELEELCQANEVECEAEIRELREGAELQVQGELEAAALLDAVHRQLCKAYLKALRLLQEQRRMRFRLNLDEVQGYIDEHFAKTISLEGIAQAFHVSKEYLSKMFKQRFDCTVNDYIIRQRMNKARKWLADEDMPIKAVAEMVGYEDVTYFYRVFKKHFGIAPGEMRRNG